MAHFGRGNTTTFGFSTTASVSKARILNNMIVSTVSQNEVSFMAQSHYSKTVAFSNRLQVVSKTNWVPNFDRKVIL